MKRKFSTRRERCTCEQHADLRDCQHPLPAFLNEAVFALMLPAAISVCSGMYISC